MTTTDEQMLERYESLKAEAQGLLKEGRFRSALVCLDAALEAVRQLGDRELTDRAICNRCRIAVELGASNEDLRQLGQVLMRNSTAELRFLASYNLLRAHLLRKDPEKALFYGRIAQRCAEQEGRASYLSAAHNGIGLALLSSSYFSEAEAEFQQAVNLLPSVAGARRAIALDNLGYCKIIRGARQSGFRDLFESLRTLRRLRERWFQMTTHVSLCFAYLEEGKGRAAVRHGRAALEIAGQVEDRATEKSALFLLGEASKLLDDEFLARRYFDRLQREHYPDNPFLPDMLMVVDARTMVNLKA